MDATVFRTCAQTGLKVDRQAERLIEVHAVAGVFAILFGGIAAILVLLTRWPAVHLLDPESFYRALTFHGINMLIFWIIFFEIAVLYFAGPIVLGSRLAWPRIGWVAFGLMVAGSLLIDAAILAGRADVMMTSYAPLQAVSYFYLGWILFAVGALVGVCNFFASLVVARIERTYEGSIPLVTFGAATAAIIAVVTLAHGAIIYIPTWLWSLGIVQTIDPGIYRLVWWGLGHSSQQINVAAMVTIWYLLATLTVGATPINEKVCRTAFLLYILFINLASAVTLAYMAVTPLLLELTGRRPWSLRWTRWQPYLYGLGLLGIMAGMHWAGGHGAPRRTFGFTWANAQALIGMNLMGLGSVLAIAGGLAFVLNMGVPLLRRPPRVRTGRGDPLEGAT
jgi:cytochrome c oxidase subunit 1